MSTRWTWPALLNWFIKVQFEKSLQIGANIQYWPGTGNTSTAAKINIFDFPLVQFPHIDYITYAQNTGGARSDKAGQFPVLSKRSHGKRLDILIVPWLPLPVRMRALQWACDGQGTIIFFTHKTTGGNHA